MEHVVFLLRSSRVLILIAISDLLAAACDKHCRSYSCLFSLASPRQINHCSKCNSRVTENRAKWSMFALLLAYNYQLFMFFCCVHEVLLQQNSLLLWLIRNPPLPGETLLWLLHLILLVLWIRATYNIGRFELFCWRKFLSIFISHVGWFMISFSAYRVTMGKYYCLYRGS